jgi:hypothetical protein
MRRAYLVDRVAIATLSMATVALTNLSFINPEKRVANRDAVQVMISRVLSSELLFGCTI